MLLFFAEMGSGRGFASWFEYSAITPTLPCRKYEAGDGSSVLIPCVFFLSCVNLQYS